MSEKFFFMQLNDFCDIAAVWSLVYVLYKYVGGDNAFAQVPPEVIRHFLFASFYEMILEVFISFFFPVLIRGCTKYKGF